MRNFQTVEVPAGQGTMNASGSPTAVAITDLVMAETITTEHDTWEKDGGITKLNSVSLGASVVALWDFFSATQVQELIAVTTTGNIYTVDTGGIVKTLATNQGSPAVWHFAEGAQGTTKFAFLTNNSRTIQLLAYSGGATLNTIANPAADWTIPGSRPTFSFAHRNRLFAGPGISLHQIYASVVDDMTDFVTTPGTLTWQLWPGEGQRLIGGCSFQRQAFVWKYPRGLYTLDDSDPNPTNWHWVKITDAVGLVSPNALVEIANDVIYLSPDGLVHSLSRTLVGSGDPLDSTVLPVQTRAYFRENFNWQFGEQMQMTFYPIKQKVYLSVPSAGSTTNNLMVVFDGHNPDQPNFTISTRDQPGALAMQRDTLTIARPIIGSPDGFIYRLDQNARHRADGTGYLSSYETKDIDLVPSGQYRANLQELEVVFARGGAWTLNIEVYRDGAYSETLVFAQVPQGGALDFMFLDTTSAVLGYDTLTQGRARLRGSARRVKLRGTNSAPDSSFSVVTHLIHFTVGSERP